MYRENKVSKKAKEYFADWRDENGKRHRRAFRTAADARAFQTKKQREVEAKKAQARKAH